MVPSLVDPGLCIKKVPCEAYGPELMTSSTQDWVCIKTKDAQTEVPCEAGFLEVQEFCVKKCPSDMSEKIWHCVKETKRIFTTDNENVLYSKEINQEKKHKLASSEDIQSVRPRRPLRPTSEVVSMVTLYILFLIIFVCLLIYTRV